MKKLLILAFFGLILISIFTIQLSLLIEQQGNQASLDSRIVAPIDPIFGIEDNSSILDITFCPSEDCFLYYYNEISNAKKSIDCAFYDFNEENLSSLFLGLSKEVTIRLIIDNEYLDRPVVDDLFKSEVAIYSDVHRGSTYNNYMHHKFCIIDNSSLVFGSANPTENGFYLNDNVVMKTDSRELITNFYSEFDQMREGKFGERKQSRIHYENILFTKQNITASSYFCPQDDCMQRLIDLIEESQHEVFFASFALTHDDLEEVLIDKSGDIQLFGIIEQRFVDVQSSRIREMEEYFPILYSKQSKTMHHKFFVIDGRYVVVGSMNPSRAGDQYNDEFIMIIESTEVAKVFKDEFIRIYERERGQK